MKEDCRNSVHSVAWVAPEKKKEKENWHERQTYRQTDREKKRGGGRGWKTKQEKNSTKISHQSWAEVFLPLSSLCPSFLLDEDFL